MQCIFVCYVYEANAILVRPMKSREATCHVEAYTEIYQYLEQRGFKPKLNVLDNECSKLVQNYIKSENVKIQLVEPSNHRVNAAKRAIQTFKNHFIAGLATVDKEFPLQLWCELLVQAEITLNLLRASRTDTSRSAYEVLEGLFDFNRTPIAPPGTKALVFEAPDKRATWAPHAIDGWYIGPAMKHYRCRRFWIPETRAVRIASTAKLFPAHTTVPTLVDIDKTMAAAQELVNLFGTKITAPTHHLLQ